MRPQIASGASIRDMFMNTIEADAAGVIALLTNGVQGVLPRKGIDPGKAAKPFLYIRLEGTAGGGDAMDTGTWAIEVHDRPGYGLMTVDKLVARLKWLFNHQTWPSPTESTERPRKSYWAGVTGELPDDGFKTIKRIARVQIIQS